MVAFIKVGSEVSTMPGDSAETIYGAVSTILRKLDEGEILVRQAKSNIESWFEKSTVLQVGSEETLLGVGGVLCRVRDIMFSGGANAERGGSLTREFYRWQNEGNLRPDLQK